MKKQKNKQEGITLIALVVTIIVLIILAGVSISMIVGENGIITQAKTAKEETEIAAEKEQEDLQKEEEYIDAALGGEKSTTVLEARGGKKYNNTTAITDDSGDTIYIPGGFKITQDSATDTDDGIVITDGENEFVWIPVKDITTMYVEKSGTALSGSAEGVTTTTNVYSKLRIREGDKSSNYTEVAPGQETGVREPDILTGADDINIAIEDENTWNNVAKSLVLEYTTIYDSIEQYNGFYVGRYELTGTIDNPSIQKAQTVITDQNWYNLREACKKLVSTQYAQTTMIYGNQWDEIINWLVTTQEKTESEVNIDSSSWGNYMVSGKTVTKEISGNNENWKANNIYDFAGNCWEWTQEARNTNDRVVRGGGYNDSGRGGPASDRGGDSPTGTYSQNSTRAVLYIK